MMDDEISRMDEKKDVLDSESKYRLGLMIAIPSRGLIDTRYMIAVYNLVDGLPTGLSWKFLFATMDAKKRNKGYIFFDLDQARQKLCEVAIANKCKYVLFIDDDVFPPADGIKKLMMANKDVISGLYWTKKKPTEPVIYEDVGTGPYFNFPQDQVFKIRAAGLGFCLIRTDVLKKMEKPWFKFKWNRKHKDGREIKAGGEDLYFFQKLENAGIQAWCHSGVMCDHLDVTRDIFYPGPDVLGRYRPELLERKETNKKIKKEIDKYGLLGHADGVWDVVHTMLPKKPTKLLNAGCGEFIPKLNKYDIHLCDIRSNKNKYKNYTVCDLNKKFPYKNNEFDGVMGIELIEHLENPRHFLRECKRVAKDFIIITFPNCESPKSIEKFRDKQRFEWFEDQDYSGSKHITPIFSWQIKQIASELGLKYSDVRYNNYNTQEINIMKLEVDSDVERKNRDKKPRK